MIQQVAGKADWKGPEIEGSEAWIYRLNNADIAEIDAALRHAKGAGRTLESLLRDDFPLTGFAGRIDQMLEEIENGLGLFLFRGFPTDSYSKEELRFIYWGIGLYCGTAVSQSKRGDVLGDVRDLGTPRDGPEFRGYTSSGELTYHVDAADVTALFCLRPAKSGGLSRIASLVAIHNEILRTRPDLLEVLYGDYPWGRQGNELPGQSPYYTQPIFGLRGDRFAARYTRTHIRTAEMSPDAPDLSPVQREALDLIDEIAARPEFHLTMMFEPGDMQFLNNHLTVHTRTEFEDFAEPDQKRHLLRLWFSPPNSHALPDGFQPFFGDIGAGAVRGGFPGHGSERLFETH